LPATRLPSSTWPWRKLVPSRCTEAISHVVAVRSVWPGIIIEIQWCRADNGVLADENATTGGWLSRRKCLTPASGNDRDIRIGSECGRGPNSNCSLISRGRPRLRKWVEAPGWAADWAISKQYKLPCK
jgi:hypothetical protein